MDIKTVSIKLPNYKLGQPINFVDIGTEIDKVVSENFPQGDIAIRAISLRDHGKLSREDLIEIISKLGTDKYDSQRKMAVAHDFYQDKGVELFAVPIRKGEKVAFASEMVEDFAVGAIQDRGYALRIDLLIIYDLNQLEEIPIQYPEWIGKDAFRFKRMDKKSALKGFVRIE